MIHNKKQNKNDQFDDSVNGCMYVNVNTKSNPWHIVIRAYIQQIQFSRHSLWRVDNLWCVSKGTILSCIKKLLQKYTS